MSKILPLTTEIAVRQYTRKLVLESIKKKLALMQEGVLGTAGAYGGDFVNLFGGAQVAGLSQEVIGFLESDSFDEEIMKIKLGQWATIASLEGKGYLGECLNWLDGEVTFPISGEEFSAIYSFWTALIRKDSDQLITTQHLMGLYAQRNMNLAEFIVDILNPADPLNLILIALGPFTGGASWAALGAKGAAAKGLKKGLIDLTQAAVESGSDDVAKLAVKQSKGFIKDTVAKGIKKSPGFKKLFGRFVNKFDVSEWPRKAFKKLTDNLKKTIDELDFEDITGDTYDEFLEEIKERYRKKLADLADADQFPEDQLDDIVDAVFETEDMGFALKSVYEAGTKKATPSITTRVRNNLRQRFMNTKLGKKIEDIYDLQVNGQAFLRQGKTAEALKSLGFDGSDEALEAAGKNLDNLINDKFTRELDIQKIFKEKFEDTKKYLEEMAKERFSDPNAKSEYINVLNDTFDSDDGLALLFDPNNSLLDLGDLTEAQLKDMSKEIDQILQEDLPLEGLVRKIDDLLPDETSFDMIHDTLRPLGSADYGIVDAAEEAYKSQLKDVYGDIISKMKSQVDADIEVFRMKDLLPDLKAGIPDAYRDDLLKILANDPAAAEALKQIYKTSSSSTALEGFLQTLSPLTILRGHAASGRQDAFRLAKGVGYGLTDTTQDAMQDDGMEDVSGLGRSMGRVEQLKFDMSRLPGEPEADHQARIAAMKDELKQATQELEAKMKVIKLDAEYGEFKGLEKEYAEAEYGQPWYLDALEQWERWNNGITQGIQTGAITKLGQLAAHLLNKNLRDETYRDIEKINFFDALGLIDDKRDCFGMPNFLTASTLDAMVSNLAKALKAANDGAGREAVLKMLDFTPDGIGPKNLGGLMTKIQGQEINQVINGYMNANPLNKLSIDKYLKDYVTAINPSDTAMSLQRRDEILKTHEKIEDAKNEPSDDSSLKPMSSQDLEDLEEGRSNMFIDNKKLRSIIRKNLLENIKKKNLITENTSNITSKEEFKKWLQLKQKDTFTSSLQPGTSLKAMLKLAKPEGLTSITNKIVGTTVPAPNQEFSPFLSPEGLKDSLGLKDVQGYILALYMMHCIVLQSNYKSGDSTETLTLNSPESNLHYQIMAISYANDSVEVREIASGNLTETPTHEMNYAALRSGRGSAKKPKMKIKNSTMYDSAMESEEFKSQKRAQYVQVSANQVGVDANYFKNWGNAIKNSYRGIPELEDVSSIKTWINGNSDDNFRVHDIVCYIGQESGALSGGVDTFINGGKRKSFNEFFNFYAKKLYTQNNAWITDSAGKDLKTEEGIGMVFPVLFSDFNTEKTVDKTKPILDLIVEKAVKLEIADPDIEIDETDRIRITAQEEENQASSSSDPESDSESASANAEDFREKQENWVLTAVQNDEQIVDVKPGKTARTNTFVYEMSLAYYIYKKGLAAKAKERAPKFYEGMYSKAYGRGAKIDLTLGGVSSSEYQALEEIVLEDALKSPGQGPLSNSDVNQKVSELYKGSRFKTYGKAVSEIPGFEAYNPETEIGSRYAVALFFRDIVNNANSPSGKSGVAKKSSSGSAGSGNGRGSRVSSGSRNMARTDSGSRSSSGESSTIIIQSETSSGKLYNGMGKKKLEQIMTNIAPSTSVFHTNMTAKIKFKFNSKGELKDVSRVSGLGVIGKIISTSDNGRVRKWLKALKDTLKRQNFTVQGLEGSITLTIKNSDSRNRKTMQEQKLRNVVRISRAFK